MISEGSCDTEDCSNDAENSAHIYIYIYIYIYVCVCVCVSILSPEQTNVISISYSTDDTLETALTSQYFTTNVRTMPSSFGRDSSN